MVRRAAVPLLAFALLSGCRPAARDDAGGGARRIVSTAPSVTEMLFALGLGDRVVGVSTFCHYPAEAAKRPKVGTFLNPAVEPILALRPDLVILIKNPTPLAERLGSLNVRVLEVDPTSLVEIETAIRRIGDAAGVPDRAGALIRDMQAVLDEIRHRVEGREKRRMAFIVGRSPGELQGMVAVGSGSYLTELIELAGGENVFADAPLPYPKVSLEEMLSRNPDVIVDMGEMAETKGVTEAQKRAVVELWRRYPALAAARTGRVFAVADDIFVVPGPRVVDAARAFGRFLHPEAMP